MPLLTWVTQPKNPFDSFYYYDTDTLGFVRIRLELGRTDQNPEPGVFAKSNRYVGFVDDPAIFKLKEFDRWSVDDKNRIVYRVDGLKSIVLSDKPAAGKSVIDFSLTRGNIHPTFIHPGNPLAEPPYRLPDNSKGKPVTEKMLKAIAESVIGQDTAIVLALANSKPYQLADAIFKLYNEIIAVPA